MQAVQAATENQNRSKKNFNYYIFCCVRFFKFTGFFKFTNIYIF